MIRPAAAGTKVEEPGVSRRVPPVAECSSESGASSGSGRSGGSFSWGYAIIAAAALVALAALYLLWRIRLRTRGGDDGYDGE